MTTWVGLKEIMLSEMSDIERQILYVITYMRNLKKMDSKKCRVKQWLPWAQSWGNRRDVTEECKLATSR